MPQRHDPIVARCPHMLHGCDYNPDQWPESIVEEDLRLMKLAGINSVSVGIFSWSQLQPAEEVFTFDWLDRLMDRLADAGIFVALATPAAAMPPWVAKKYPETMKAGPDGHRWLHDGRVHFCWSSPIYRRLVGRIDEALADRYKDHPALGIWHIGNEYAGQCHCPLCQDRFGDYLRARYGDVETLNRAWWSRFWSHRYTSFEEITPYEGCLPGLKIDWNRFCTRQIVDFISFEAAAVGKHAPDTPVTTNLMGFFPPQDYHEYAKVLDAVSEDAYPQYHLRQQDAEVALNMAYTYDLMRSMKDKPWLLMETTPSSTNWMPVSKLKRPGVHFTTAMQALAHGSDSVMYFQWRKGRGGAEQNHGAVVDHVGHENTRVFAEVAEVGETLRKLDGLVGTMPPAVEAAVLHDWQAHWAVEISNGPNGPQKQSHFRSLCHYRPLWQRAVACDVIAHEADLGRYKLLMAPMLFLLRDGLAGRIEQFVRDGGVFVTTYLSGRTDENMLSFTGGWPGPLRELAGVRSEEIDCLYDDERVDVVFAESNELGVAGTYQARGYCDLIHAESAEVLATYGSEFYAGRPAVTVNRLGKGRAYYIAPRMGEDFLAAFYGALAARLELASPMGPGGAALPDGVSVQSRSSGSEEYLFAMNFSTGPQSVDLGRDLRCPFTGEPLASPVQLKPGHTVVAVRPA
mgnify:FL=1